MNYFNYYQVYKSRQPILDHPQLIHRQSMMVGDCGMRLIDIWAAQRGLSQHRYDRAVNALHCATAVGLQPCLTELRPGVSEAISYEISKSIAIGYSRIFREFFSNYFQNNCYMRLTIAEVFERTFFFIEIKKMDQLDPLCNIWKYSTIFFHLLKITKRRKIYWKHFFSRCENSKEKNDLLNFFVVVKITKTFFLNLYYYAQADKY